MSVLIKGMEMPKRHLFEGLVAIGDGQIVVKDLENNKLFEGEIKEIPTPHGRLIDADELFCKIDGIKGWDYGDESDMAISAAEALSAIDDSPTVIEAEVSE